MRSNWWSITLIAAAGLPLTTSSANQRGAVGHLDRGALPVDHHLHGAGPADLEAVPQAGGGHLGEVQPAHQLTLPLLTGQVHGRRLGQRPPGPDPELVADRRVWQHEPDGAL